MEFRSLVQKLKDFDIAGYDAKRTTRMFFLSS